MTSLADLRITDVLHVARARGASDIHMSPGVPPAIRVDGVLEYVGGAALTLNETQLLTGSLFDDETLQDVRRGDDRSMTWVESGQSIRVHAFCTRGGVAIAMRLLHTVIQTLESLGLPEVVASFATRARGLVVFAGPTGSGKSTSLAAVIDHINQSSARRIVTIEDPIEYQHINKQSLITQREVGRDTPSFSQALVGALRADPDVIMVGEMRDVDTMRAALTAAETGHLVLTTLHTGDAAHTVDRIIDAFDAGEQAQIRSQLSQVLTAVVCQRLTPRACGPGRRVVAEVLVATDAVRNVIREGRTHQLRNVMLTGRQQGMQTLEHHIGLLLAEREIEPIAAMALTECADEVRVMVEV